MDLFTRLEISGKKSKKNMNKKVWFGEDPCVVMADYATIRETFLRDGDTFAGRHFFPEGISSVLPGFFSYK
jgi:hypothetical protein